MKDNMKVQARRPRPILVVASYWILVVLLFLLIPVVIALFLYGSWCVESGNQGYGWVIVGYLLVVGTFGQIPGAIALILCVVNLIRMRSFSENDRRLVVYLCGIPLVIVLLTVLLIGLPFIIPIPEAFSAPDWLRALIGIVYTTLLIWPWIVVKRKKLI